MSLFARAAAPEKFRIVVTSKAGIDLTQVISAAAEVVKPGGARTTWTFGIEAGASAQRLVVVRVFSADGRDLPAAGHVEIGLRLTFPGAVVRRTKPIIEPVLQYLGA